MVLDWYHFMNKWKSPSYYLFYMKLTHKTLEKNNKKEISWQLFCGSLIITFLAFSWRFSTTIMPKFLNLKMNRPEDSKSLIPTGEEVSILPDSNSSG